MWEFGLDIAFVDAPNRWNIIVESGRSDDDVRVLVLIVFVGGFHGDGVIGNVYTLLGACSSCVCAEIAPSLISFLRSCSLRGHRLSCTVVFRRQCTLSCSLYSRVLD